MSEFTFFKGKIIRLAFLLFMLFFSLTSSGSAKMQRGSTYPPGQWDHIIENQTFTKTLSIDSGDDNTLIINAIFQSIDDHAIMVRNASNIYIKDCIISDISGFGILLRGTGSTSNVTIDGCTISNTSSSGIMVSQRWEDGVDHPNLVIKNNTVFNSGSNDHQHNIFVQSTDSLIENNLVSNTSGNGISIRSTGIIRNNTISGSGKSCIRYYNDHVPGPSDTLIIENNTCQLENAGINGSPAISLLQSPLSPVEWLAGSYIIQGNTIILSNADRYGFKVESAIFEGKEIIFSNNRIVNSGNEQKAFSANYVDYLANNQLFDSVADLETEADQPATTTTPVPVVNEISGADETETNQERIGHASEGFDISVSLTLLGAVLIGTVITLYLIYQKRRNR